MTYFENELVGFADKTYRAAWTTRAGRKVPDVDDLTAGNQAVTFEGAVLYADLTESTALVRGYYNWFAADIYKTYLYCAGRIITSCGGSITAYDGDRVMGVFIGDTKADDAALAGLKINYAVREILNPALVRQFGDGLKGFVLRQKVGIDISELFVAKTGVRASNDLVWVGNAANNAAKMAALDLGYSTYITEPVRDALSENARYGGSPRQDMWSRTFTSAVPGTVYGSGWQSSI
ncbi:adenylate/guanylate cyclase domain-containing protein [Leifsonia sp. Leaf264]|uniref:adenylate/guanylate cyclase domain-containing protein n=1 Tax=Leifsonia sp. Leaf264 TaxID=1736314 RepID=UPI00070041E5|nr:adenylate/guanylate cyclase domain-containing protein [Leifsonia sp. Leaf264]KQP01419.1 adenylate/guanylate cyclase [Leifsonia sp. Leaf264]